MGSKYEIKLSRKKSRLFQIQSKASEEVDRVRMDLLEMYLSRLKDEYQFLESDKQKDSFLSRLESLATILENSDPRV